MPNVLMHDGMLVDAALKHLVALEVLPGGDVNMTDFDRFMNSVSQDFRVDESAITTKMARFLFAIARARRPKNVLVIGSFQGNSLVWLAGGAGKTSHCVGVDIDAAASERARDNFLSLSMNNVVIEEMDGHLAGQLFENEIDMILLDADAPTSGKKIYTTLTNALLPKLAPGGLLLAHDMTWPHFQE
ncbi:MAG: class I SAM-dependent methyltransferase, partial [Candidatus Obscuribacterales bacterium]|nr:class I SAM-dependent methyltransferase [Candidatus Obscuribacterales bacterium]